MYSKTIYLTFIRGSQEYKDFWLFLERYEAFHKKHVPEKQPKGETVTTCTFNNNNNNNNSFIIRIDICKIYVPTISKGYSR